MQTYNPTSRSFRLRASIVFSLLLSLAGCGGGGMSLIAFGPATQTIDVGTTVNLNAAVINDVTAQGATFTSTGPGTLGTPVVTRLSSSDQIALPFTATAVGTANVTATAVHTPSQTATITINIAPALTITPATLPAGTVTLAYTATITAAGGSGTITYAVSAGTLPAGLSLSPTTGILSGKPTTAGSSSFTVTATDQASAPGTVSQAYTLVINSLPPTVTPATLPTAVVGSAYAQQLAYTGGSTATPVFAITAGSLPAASGLTLSSSGLIAGTPAAASAGQTYSFSVNVTTGTQTSPSVAFSLTVASVPVITTTSIPPGNVSIAYRAQLAYTGGVGTASFAITAGSLPAASGLTLSTSGLISGTPTAVATYTFSVTVTVGTQTSAPQPYTLVVNSLVITSGATAMGEAQLPFSFRLIAAGGSAPYTWSLAPGSAPLPTGLALNGTTGLITGTPAAASTTLGIVVQAVDSAATPASATQKMTFTINAARDVSKNALLTGTYVFQLSGFDAQGRPQASAGRFLADGLGNITSGTIDTNGTGLTAAQTAVALLPGTYSAGADNRGKLTLVTAAGTSTFTFALNTVTSGLATGGSMSQFDLTGQTRSGILALQSTTLPLPTGAGSGYAFGLQGFAAGSTATTLTHRAAAGEFQLTAGTTVSSAEVLLSSSNTAAPIVATAGTLTLAATGRGTLALALPNVGTLNFVVYEVSPLRLLLLSTDATTTRDLYSGQALTQTTANGSFNNASLNAAAVFHAEKLTTGNPDMQLGLLTGAGTGVFTQSFDENSGGALTATSSSGTYSVAANGRVTITVGAAGLGGCTDCTSGSTYAYLTGTNQGFLLDFSTGALSGFFEPQTATAFVNGAYSLASPEPLSAAAISTTGSAAVLTGALTATEDVVNQLTLTPDLAVSATITGSANGRITTSISGPGYVVSATRAETLDTTARPVLQVLQHQ